MVVVCRGNPLPTTNMYKCSVCNYVYTKDSYMASLYCHSVLDFQLALSKFILNSTDLEFLSFKNWWVILGYVGRLKYARI